MPYVRKKKSMVPFKRRFRKVYRKRRRNLRILRSPVSRIMFTKLKYAEKVNRTAATASAPFPYVMSANGLYDPNITGTGHQPRGWDQLMALYDHAVVLGCRVKVTFSQDSTVTEVANCGISFIDNASSLSTVNDYLESGYTKSITLGGTVEAIKPLIHKINPNKFLGRSKPLADPDLKNSSSSNPSEQVYIHIWSSQHAGTQTPVYYNIEIEYLVAFIEPKVPDQS